MKKSTCKMLLYIAIFIFIISLIFSYSILNMYLDSTRWQRESNFGRAMGLQEPSIFRILFGTIIIAFLLPFGWVSIVLIIIALTKWNSENTKIRKTR